MQFNNTFCPSPWYHMRINNDGFYEYCRWEDKSYRNQYTNIKDMSPISFFQNEMQQFRYNLLNNIPNPQCNDCMKMEKFAKISGRQKQLLKIGCNLNTFDKSLLSSPWVNEFKYTLDNNTTNCKPIDWQIDLGNYCNAACIFCTPQSSSKIAIEYQKLQISDNIPNNSWCNDKNNIIRFLADLTQTKNLHYVHFIGGETIITPAFKVILQELINANLHKKITIGFTTNLMVWDDTIVNLLCKFNTVNLGLSIEAFHKVNDYVRWPAKIDEIEKIIEKWLCIARDHNWLVQLRTTPTIFSITNLDTVYEFAINNNIIVESCDFLDKPEIMRPNVLPGKYRDEVITKLQAWVDKYYIETPTTINIRNPSTTQSQLVQDLQSYINYFKQQKSESYRLPELVEFIKILEGNRHNSILEYLPEYEEFLRIAGY